MEQIRAGFFKGLSEEQVAFYANPKYSVYQMYEIREGFLGNLTAQQIQFYLDEFLSYEQMEAVRNGLNQGISEEKLSVYKIPNLTDTQVKVITEHMKDIMHPDRFIEYINKENCKDETGIILGIAASNGFSEQQLNKMKELNLEQMEFVIKNMHSISDKLCKSKTMNKKSLKEQNER